jgi:hypothetical protein
MVYLAHIRAEHARNYRSYGRKRMTGELRDQGIVIGERRVLNVTMPALVWGPEVFPLGGGSRT